MSVTIKYKVKKPFKYGGKTFRKDEEWVPGEGKYDEHIIEHGLVVEERVRTYKPKKKGGDK